MKFFRSSASVPAQEVRELHTIAMDLLGRYQAEESDRRRYRNHAIDLGAAYAPRETERSEALNTVLSAHTAALANIAIKLAKVGR